LRDPAHACKRRETEKIYKKKTKIQVKDRNNLSFFYPSSSFFPRILSEYLDTEKGKPGLFFFLVFGFGL